MKAYQYIIWIGGGLLCGGLLVFAWSCTRTVNLNPDNLGARYFPLETGNFVEYQAREVIYTTTEAPTTRNFLVREVVRDTFLDINKQVAFHVERYSRPGILSAWRLDSIWVSKRTPSQAVRTENNLSVIRLVFPIREGQTWNGNALNGLGSKTFTMQNIGRSATINNQFFPRSLRVVQSNDSSLVKVDIRSEVYAENVGLVQQDLRVLNYCAETNCIGRGIITFGRIYTLRIINYGKL